MAFEEQGRHNACNVPRDMALMAPSLPVALFPIPVPGPPATSFLAWNPICSFSSTLATSSAPHLVL